MHTVGDVEDPVQVHRQIVGSGQLGGSGGVGPRSGHGVGMHADQAPIGHKKRAGHVHGNAQGSPQQGTGGTTQIGRDDATGENFAHALVSRIGDVEGAEAVHGEARGKV